jgi:hypothetical protein
MRPRPRYGYPCFRGVNWNYRPVSLAEFEAGPSRRESVHECSGGFFDTGQMFKGSTEPFGVRDRIFRGSYAPVILLHGWG